MASGSASGRGLEHAGRAARGARAPCRARDARRSSRGRDSGASRPSRTLAEARPHEAPSSQQRDELRGRLLGVRRGARRSTRAAAGRRRPRPRANAARRRAGAPRAGPGCSSSETGGRAGRLSLLATRWWALAPRASSSIRNGLPPDSRAMRVGDLQRRAVLRAQERGGQAARVVERERLDRGSRAPRRPRAIARRRSARKGLAADSSERCVVTSKIGGAAGGRITSTRRAALSVSPH